MIVFNITMVVTMIVIAIGLGFVVKDLIDNVKDLKKEDDC
jgi:hypothetical protein